MNINIDSSQKASAIDDLMQTIAITRSFVDHYIAESRGQTGTNPDLDLAKLNHLAKTLTLPPPLETLCHTFGLSPFERWMLLGCAGQAILPDFPDLLAIAHNKPDWTYFTFQLACQCFPEADWQAITENSPLRRWQLIHPALNPEIPRACLQIDEAILHYLMGEPYQDPVLSNSITPLSNVPQIPLQGSQQDIFEQVRLILHSQQNTPPLVQLCGTIRGLQRAIAHQVSTTLQLPLYHLPSKAIPHNHEELQRLLLRWQRWVKLAPSLLLVEVHPNHWRENQSNPPLLETFLESVQTPVIISTDQRLFLQEQSLFTFDVMGLQYQEQLDLWQNAWQDTDLSQNEVLPKLAAQFRLSATLIQTVSAAVQSETVATVQEKCDRLWDFCRLQSRPQLEGLAQPIEVQATWDDLILPEREKAILQQIIVHVRQQAQVYQQWGFANKHKRGLGLTALFAGASGTGKTLAAEVIAHTLKLDLFRIDLSAVMSKYIGETEKNLRRIFDAAEVGGAVLLFDEADALFGKRTQVKDSHDRHANIEVSYLLQRMESYQGLAILTSNLKDDLDQAFLRRLRFIITFRYPSFDQRSQIWQRIFPPQTPTKGLDYDLLGQLDVTGGNIKSIALNAAFLAADAQEAVTMKHILEAAKVECMKLGRSLTSADTRGWEID